MAGKPEETLAHKLHVLQERLDKVERVLNNTLRTREEQNHLIGELRRMQQVIYDTSIKIQSTIKFSSVVPVIVGATLLATATGTFTGYWGALYSLIFGLVCLAIAGKMAG
ncbi:hypothetical protein F4781DRAFT_441721 [Annulohypoxylon bovei var. microspora]|nr:hypothetical protein F4781DRAFT_441721 [Annulohypoxylon bovei var. microspora]